MISKPKHRTLAQLKRDLWKIISQYIRLRDCLKTTGTKEQCICINCGRLWAYSDIQAGHFLPAGRYSAVRYTELNINGECRGCNKFDKFKLSYEAYLKVLYGNDTVEGLKFQAHFTPTYQWKRAEVLNLIAEYSMKLESLNKEA